MQYKIWRQYVIPQHWLSRWMGWFTTRTWSWLKNWQIRCFTRVYAVDLTHAEHKTSDGYATFNDFFTRRLTANARPICQDPYAIASPVDGRLVQAGVIDGTQLIQAKGQFFELKELLGGSGYEAMFTDGLFATIYLAPADYHRVHMPIDGAISKTIYVPGKLFSVNALTSAHVPRLFARNERVVCLFDTAVGTMAVVLVGAMFVASIVTRWEGTVGVSRPRRIYKKDYDQSAMRLHRGEELGYFSFGSTVILLYPQGVARWRINTGETVCVGQGIGEIFINNRFNSLPKKD